MLHRKGAVYKVPSHETWSVVRSKCEKNHRSDVPAETVLAVMLN